MKIGVVAIGRNEGERLVRCLASLDPMQTPTIYVDSGSTDGSVSAARAAGAEVVELDLSIPFTAARARNAGAARLLERFPEVDAIQFVDGDCEVVPGWLTIAAQTLTDDMKLSCVTGRRRERHPEASVYNRLCDLEWNTPIGETQFCGGDVLTRRTAFEQVGGYDGTLIAGEDYEICIRYRQAGWKLLRIDAEMTIHDAAIHRARQWHKRAVRCGHAYAEGYDRYGRPPERHFRREVRRLLFWGGVLPVILLTLAWPTQGWSLLGFLIYPVQALRIARTTSLAFGVSCMVTKFSECIGFVKYQLSRRRPRRLIEYK